MTQISFRNFSHLGQNHGGYLLGGELFLLALIGDDDHGLLPGTGDDSKGPVTHVALDGGVGESPADEAFGVEDGVGRVHGDLVFGSVTN